MISMIGLDPWSINQQPRHHDRSWPPSVFGYVHGLMVIGTDPTHCDTETNTVADIRWLVWLPCDTNPVSQAMSCRTF